MSELVVGQVDVTSPFAGAFLIEDGHALVAAIKGDSWVEGGLASFSAVMDTAALIIDPLGTLIANGLGWMMDHIEPLKGWLNDFTGNAGEVLGFAGTWGNIATRMEQVSAAYSLEALEAMAGDAIEAYERFAADLADHMSAAGQWAGAVSRGLEVASGLVEAVHALIRDAVSQVVGTAISAAATAVLTVGLGTPWAIGQVTSRVASLTGRVSSFMARLVNSLKSLTKIFSDLVALFSRAVSKIRPMLRSVPQRGGRAPAAGPGRPPGAGRGGSSSGPPPRTLYRSDDRPPEDIFAQGFRPRNPDNHDLADFVRHNTPSNYVSTTTDQNLYRQWGSPWRYEIRDPGHGIDVNRAIPDNIFANEFEIAFPGGIRTQDITGVRRLGPDGVTLLDFIANPHFGR